MRSRIVTAAGALLAVGVVVAVVFALVETDEEKIEKLVRDLRDAALNSDVDGLLDGLSDEVEYPGGRGKLEIKIRAVLRDWPPKKIAVEIRDLEIDGDRATADVEVWYTSERYPQPYRAKFRTDFGRHDERWLVDGVSQVGG